MKQDRYAPLDLAVSSMEDAATRIREELEALEHAIYVFDQTIGELREAGK